MVRHCAVEDCGNFLIRCGRPIHQFPKDEQLRALWIRLARPSFPTWLPTDSDRLCSDHFRDEDYERSPRVMESVGVPVRNVRLKPGVLPSYFSKKRKSDEHSEALDKRRKVGHFGPDEFQIAPRRTSSEEEKNANDVQDDSAVQESESILPDDGPGWGGSSDESTISANTIKTEPPDYVEQDKEPGSHFASVKSESQHYLEDWEHNSRVAALTKGLDGSSGNSAMTAVTIKTEPPEHVEQDEEPCSHLVSVKSGQS
uniref:THAP-type domain-containing protein n=1 Tax=Ixodes ricinus TaxID=34613 RepID=A0A6B0V603_IXORI